MVTTTTSETNISSQPYCLRTKQTVDNHLIFTTGPSNSNATLKVIDPEKIEDDSSEVLSERDKFFLFHYFIKVSLVNN